MTQSIIGLDIGGSKIYAARYRDDFEVLAETRHPSEGKKGRSYVLANMEESIRDVMDKNTEAIGISWAGFTDSKKGIIRHAPNIYDFEDFPLKEYLQSVFHLPVFVENDAKLFTLAEHKIYPKKTSVFLGLIIGTGVGSGVIIDGQILQGDTSFAGEVGHMILDTDKHLEAEQRFAGPALTHLFGEAMDVHSLRQLDEFWLTQSDRITDIMHPVLKDLAVWMYNLLLAYNPGYIVFGGGVGKNFLPFFEDILREEIQALIDAHRYPMRCDFGFSTLKNAGAFGAAVLAKEAKENL